MAIFHKPHIRTYFTLAVLTGIHLLAAGADYLAPYDYALQNRDCSYTAPTSIHILDSNGHLQWPFVYALRKNNNGSACREDQTAAYRIHLFVADKESSSPMLGHSQQHNRLFGVDEPGKIYLLGTDAYGRDQFSRLLYGSRISLSAGLLGATVALTLGVLLGSVAGFYGKWLDECLMRASELFLIFPSLYLLFAVRAALPIDVLPNQIFLTLVILMGIIGWARPARLIRGVVLSAKEREYVLAARTFGASDAYLLRRHILPQIIGTGLAQAAVLVPRFIMAEVALSFFGLGIGEPEPSWGSLLACLRQYQVIQLYWWMWLPLLAVVPAFMAYYYVCSYYVYRFHLGTGNGHGD